MEILEDSQALLRMPIDIEQPHPILLILSDLHSLYTAAPTSSPINKAQGLSKDKATLKKVVFYMAAAQNYKRNDWAGMINELEKGLERVQAEIGEKEEEEVGENPGGGRILEKPARRMESLDRSDGGGGPSPALITEL